MKTLFKTLRTVTKTRRRSSRMTTSSDSPSAPQTQLEMRAQLREGFLRAVMELNGEPCSIVTYENSVLPATFAGWKTDGSEILVREMNTPAAVQMDSALMRTPDILAVKFDKPLLLP